VTRPATCLAVGGATATGKTVLAVEIALAVGGELVNADSRQVMRRLHAGTASPTADELRGVRCHLLDETEPGVALSAAAWLRRAREVLADLDRRGVPAVVVGGTGQYIRALRQGWTFGGTTPDPRQRAELDSIASTAEGRQRLVAELRARDPRGAATIDEANPRRVVRALELLRAGAPSLARARGREGGVKVALVVLDSERQLQSRVIDERIAAMFDRGTILSEVHEELDRGTSPDALRRAGIGYGEAVDVVAGTIDVDAARESTRRRTTHYAKAQRTWFRHEPAVARLIRDGTSTTPSLVAEAMRAAGVETGVSR
jgi:tRNA dimethylallyltransferase